MRYRATFQRLIGFTFLVPLLMGSGCGDDGTAAREAGLQALRTGRAEQAISALEKARTRLAADPTIYCNLGIAYWQVGQLEPAVEMLQRAAALAPSDTQAPTYLVQLFGDLKRLEDARAVYDDALKRNSQPSARLVTALAVAEYRAGHSEKASDLLQRALTINPSYPPALYNLAVIEQDLPDAQDAVIGWLERYSDVEPDGPRADQVAALLLELRGSGSLGRATASGSIGDPYPYTPSPADPLIARARKASAQQDFDTALVLLKQAAGTDARSASALWELARLYERGLNDATRARETFKRFERDFPDDPRAARQLGTRTERNPRPAREAYQEGVSLFKEERYREAVSSFVAALEDDNRLVGAAYYLGSTYKQLGLLVRARNEFLYCLALAPDMADAHYTLGTVYRDLKDNTMALEHLERALELKPEHAYAHLYMGYALQELGKASEAVTHFSRFVQLAPSNDPAAKRMKEWLDSRR